MKQKTVQAGKPALFSSSLFSSSLRPHPCFLVSFGMLAQPFIEFIFGWLALQFIAETAA